MIKTNNKDNPIESPNSNFLLVFFLIWNSASVGLWVKVALGLWVGVLSIEFLISCILKEPLIFTS